jgi:hypothetical protein
VNKKAARRNLWVALLLLFASLAVTGSGLAAIRFLMLQPR